MTIKDFIIEKETKMVKERLEQLEKFGAPTIIIEKTKEVLEQLENGELKVGGDKSLLESEFIQCVVKKGRGGKVYLEFDNVIKYFPEAKYGRYITK
jgi:hypothetical protein